MIGEFRLRVKFALQGRLVMLSHLEVTRTVERIVRRSDLPFAVTQGFSPHMKLSFGAALPVGVGGMQEIFDVWLTDYVDNERALSALQQASPEDCRVYEVSYIPVKSVAASDVYPFSKYWVELSRAIDVALPESIVVLKKNKERMLQVRDFVRGFNVQENVLEIVLEAKKTGSLRIDVLVDALIKESAGKDSDKNSGEGIYARSIMRVVQAECLEAL